MSDLNNESNHVFGYVAAANKRNKRNVHAADIIAVNAQTTNSFEIHNSREQNRLLEGEASVDDESLSTNDSPPERAREAAERALVAELFQSSFEQTDHDSSAAVVESGLLSEQTVPPADVDKEHSGYDDSPNDEEEMQEQFACVRLEPAQLEKSAIYIVQHLQNCVGTKEKIERCDTRKRTFARVRIWLEMGIPARKVNTICNVEATQLGQKSCNPNLPMFAFSHLDPHIVFPKKVTFKVVTRKANSEEIALQLTVISFFRDAENAILNRIVANCHSGLGTLGHHYTRCGSVSEVYQTPYFKDAVSRVHEKFGNDVTVIPLDIYADATALNTSRQESIHPINIQFDAGYDRHAKARIFSKFSVTIGWMPPPFKHFQVKKGSKYVSWDELTNAEEKELVLKMHAEIVIFLFEEIRDALLDKVFQFPYPGMKKTAFVIHTMKADQPEKNKWSNTIHCQICNDPYQLLLGDELFRNCASPGQTHGLGIDLIRLYHGLQNPGNPFEVFYPVDIMHCQDNVQKHLVRLIALYIGQKENNFENTVVVDGKCFRTVRKSHGLVWQNTSSLASAGIAASSIDKADRVTTIEANCKSTTRWAEFKKIVFQFGGEQALKLMEGKGSMEDRTFGLPGLVLALEYALFHSKNDVFRDTAAAFARKDLSEMVAIFFSIFTLLTDCAPGFLIKKLHQRFERFRDLFLDLAAKAGISSVPISLHTYFHFPKLIERFGAPRLYSLYEEESHHRQQKDAVMDNTNNQLGESGFDKLGQVLTREARLDVCGFLRPEVVPDVTRDEPRAEYRQKVMLKGQNNDIFRNSVQKVASIFARKKSIETWSLLGAGERMLFDCASCKILDKHGQTAVFEEVAIAWGAIEKECYLRVLAMAPNSDNYFIERCRYIKDVVKGCENPRCFACSGVEFSCTTAVNSSSTLADEYFIPLAYSYANEGKTVICHAIPLEVEEYRYGGVYKKVKLQASALSRVNSTPPIVNLNMQRYFGC